MTLPRFRLRTLMVVVAATALVLAIGITCQRMARLSSEYRARASEWQRKAGIAAANASVYRISDAWHPDPAVVALAEPYGRQFKHCRAMKMKYRHAADHPWRPVAPDPPDPR